MEKWNKMNVINFNKRFGVNCTNDMSCDEFANEIEEHGITVLYISFNGLDVVQNIEEMQLGDEAEYLEVDDFCLAIYKNS